MRTLSWLLFVPLIGCSLPEAKPPSAEFLVADGGSTFWVKSGPSGIHARVSPLILTRAEGRFYEVFVGESTRSYGDALFSGEPIYRRDLITGESTLLWQDERIGAWERAYLAAHPAARLMDPDEESDDVSLFATGESEILGIVGPFILYTHRSNFENLRSQRADTARGIIDVRIGKAVPIAALASDTAAISDGGVREKGGLRWPHAGYDVIARLDTTRNQTQVLLRDRRNNHWPLGYVKSPVPRIFWLDEKRVDDRIRTAIGDAFDGALSDEDLTQLVSRGATSARRLKPLERATKVFLPALAHLRPLRAKLQ
jgi:hypothetical protein